MTCSLRESSAIWVARIRSYECCVASSARSVWSGLATAFMVVLWSLDCLVSPYGFLGASRQALTKLGVTWEPTGAEQAYNEGRSTQVPVNPVVRVKGRFSRRLRDGSQELVLERLSVPLMRQRVPNLPRPWYRRLTKARCQKPAGG